MRKKINIKKTQLPQEDPIKSLGEIKKIINFLKLKKSFFTSLDKGLPVTVSSYD